MSTRTSGPVEKLFRVTKNPEQTRAFGETIGRRLEGGEVLALAGEIGSGKTTLVQGIAKGAGVRSPYVASPTFVLVSTHQGRVTFHHIDLYRLQGNLQIEDLGFFDYLCESAVAVIEWADRAGSLLPAEHLRIDMDLLSESERRISVCANGNRYVDLIRTLERASHGTESEH